jgi:RHS repeat-associated protein
MEKDEETSLSSHGVRMYATWLGRWTSGDSSGLKAGINRYRYCSANPIGRVDVDGRQDRKLPVGPGNFGSAIPPAEMFPYPQAPPAPASPELLAYISGAASVFAEFAAYSIGAPGYAVDDPHPDPTLHSISQQLRQYGQDTSPTWSDRGETTVIVGTALAPALGEAETVPPPEPMPGARMDETIAPRNSEVAEAPTMEPTALVNGSPVLPTAARWTGYHGTSTSPDVVFEEGLPAGGSNRDLAAHAGGASDSAFRGTTETIFTPDRAAGAGLWAGEGGFAYKIVGVPGWDINMLLQGRRPIAGGAMWGDAPMPGEIEIAIDAEVPSEFIEGAYPIERGATGLRPGAFIPNPNFVPPGLR